MPRHRPTYICSYTAHFFQKQTNENPNGSKRKMVQNANDDDENTKRKKFKKEKLKVCRGKEMATRKQK